MEESESMVDNTEHLKEWRPLDGESQIFDREKKGLVNNDGTPVDHLSNDGTPVDHAVRCEI